MTILAGDWYGFTNTIIIILLILVRVYMIQANRNLINHTVAVVRLFPITFIGALDTWNKKRKIDPNAPQPSPDA
jgi:hypothetical protein